MKSRGTWRALVSAALIAAFVTVSVPFVWVPAASAGIGPPDPPVAKRNASFEWLDDYSSGPIFMPYKTLAYDWNNDGRTEILSGGFNTAEDNSYVYAARLDSDMAYTDIGDVTGEALTGWHLVDFAVADFNLDGYGDLVVASEGDPPIVYYGNGGTEPIDQTTLGVAEGNAVAAGDFDGDTYPDVVVSNGENLEFFKGRGASGFDTSVQASPAMGTVARGLTVLDYNRDGNLDIASASTYVGSSGVCLGQGNGTFDEPTGPTAGMPFIAVAVSSGDFNGDGWPDVAWGAATPGGPCVAQDVSTYSGDRAESWWTETPTMPFTVTSGNFNADAMDDVAWEADGSIYAACSTPEGPRAPIVVSTMGELGKRQYPVAGDFAKDGLDDIAVTNDERIETFVNTTVEPRTVSLTVTSTVDLADLGPEFAGSQIKSIDVADMNRDGAQDVVATLDTGDAAVVCVALLDGRGKLLQQWSVGAGDDVGGLKIADLDKDGIPDIVVATLNGIVAFRNAGNGLPELRFVATPPPDNLPTDVDVGDLDRDGWPDIGYVSQQLSGSTAGWYDIGPGFSCEWGGDILDNGGGHSAAMGYTGADHVWPYLTVVPGAQTSLLGLAPGEGLSEYWSWNRTGDVYEDISDWYAVAFGDLTGDGMQDAVVSSTGKFKCVENDHDGGATISGVGLPYPGVATSWPGAVAAADIDFDSVDEGVAAVRLNEGGGSFAGRVDVVNFASPWGITQLSDVEQGLVDIDTADINRDGRLDIIGGQYEGTKVYFYLSKPQVATVETSLTLSPSEPNGTNGWYTVPPSVNARRLVDDELAEGTTYYEVDDDATVDSASTTEASFNVELAEGTHWLSAFSATSDSTETPPVRTAAVKYDGHAPSTQIHGLPDGTSGVPVQFTLSATDGLSGVYKSYYQVGGGPVLPYNGLPVTVSAAGATTVKYRSVDMAGNSEAWKEATVYIDPDVPTTYIEGIDAGWVNTPQTFSLYATSPTGIEWTRYSLDGGTEADFEDPVTVSEEGTTTIGYHSKNAAGTEGLRTVSALIDYTKPIVTTEVDPSYDVSAEIPITASDALSGVDCVQWRLDGGTTQTASTCVVTTPGYHTLRIAATDNARNVSALHTFSFKLRTEVALTAPTCYKSTLTRWRPYTFRSYMTPKESGAKVNLQIQKKVRGRYKTVRTVTASMTAMSDRMYARKILSFGSRGSYRIRATHSDAISIPSYSEWSYVYVR